VLRWLIRNRQKKGIEKRYDDAKKTIGDWLIQNGTPVETTLMAWEKMPALSALKQLPQSAN